MLRPFLTLACLVSAMSGQAQVTRVVPIISPFQPDEVSLGKPNCLPADYPPGPFRAMTQGTTTLRVAVDPEGNVADSTVIAPSGERREHRMLDKASVENTKSCKFRPAQISRLRYTTLELKWSISVEMPASSPQ